MRKLKKLIKKQLMIISIGSGMGNNDVQLII
jgi:hypothetical protein